MSWLTQTTGIALIVLTTADIFMTVLYPRTGKSPLSMPLSKGVWNLFRQIGHWLKNDSLLSYCGSVILIVLASVWICLFILGFALFVWSALGNGIYAAQGKTPTDFGTALYYSGFNFTTLGIGDLVPKTTVCRLVTILQAALGFATFTVTLTYLLSVLNALTQRNVFALSLHHRTGTKANAAELVLGWGINGQFDNAKQDISDMARDLLLLLESHHSYPILHYFRFQKAEYSLARMTLITMDTASLLQSALHPQQYRSLIHSAALTELETGGLYMLKQLADSFLSKCPEKLDSVDQEWREWYYYVVERLKSEGIKTPEDLEAGADLYVSLRRKWNGNVAGFAQHMAFKWRDIAPAEAKLGGLSCD